MATLFQTEKSYTFSTEPQEALLKNYCIDCVINKAYQARLAVSFDNISFGHFLGSVLATVSPVFHNDYLNIYWS
tara:strand:+ start:1173 stop:1394 length:222 start_codon:yes stop_codon:yes gene_type:complete